MGSWEGGKEGGINNGSKIKRSFRKAKIKMERATRAANEKVLDSEG